MVLLLNYFPVLLAIIFLFIAYKVNTKYKGNTKLQLRYTFFTCAGFLASLIVFTALSNTYLPKGTTARMEAPVYEAPAEDVVIQDRLRKPVKDAKQSEADFQQMVDWRKAKADRDAARVEREEKKETVEK